MAESLLPLMKLVEKWRDPSLWHEQCSERRDCTDCAAELEAALEEADALMFGIVPNDSPLARTKAQITVRRDILGTVKEPSND